jgi:hypothetical protein
MLRTHVKNAVSKIRKSYPSNDVPMEFANLLPLVMATAERLKQRDGWDHPAGVRSAPKEVLDIQTTKNSLDRALRLMDALLKALEPNGFTARVDPDKGRTLLEGANTTLTIQIVEQVTRTNHTATPSEARALNRYYQSFQTGTNRERPDIPHYDWDPTGRLTLTVGEWPSRKWNDTHRSLIDRRLSGIVATIIGLAETKYAREAEERRRQHAYQEARARYEAQVRTRNQERLKLRELFRDASRMRRANDLRELITAFEEHARRDGEYTAEKQHWVAWAKAKADWVDPLVRRSDPILDAPEPEAPDYWRF